MLLSADGAERVAMRVLRGLIVVMALLVGGWFVFDGAHALVTGDYVTPSSGPHAGQLGPWHHAVEAVGIGARSTEMKWVFVVYGAAWCVMTGFYAAGRRWAWWGMVAWAAGSLWYLPFGTVLGLGQLGLLVLERRRRGRGGRG